MTHSNNQVQKTVVDCVLAVIVIVQLLGVLFPNKVHHYVGILFCICLIIHIIQHRAWLRALTKGHWTSKRIVGTCVNLATMVSAITLGASGFFVQGSARRVFKTILQGQVLPIESCVHLTLVIITVCLVLLHVGLQVPRIVRCLKSNKTKKNVAPDA